MKKLLEFFCYILFIEASQDQKSLELLRNAAAGNQESSWLAHGANADESTVISIRGTPQFRKVGTAQQNFVTLSLASYTNNFIKIFDDRRCLTTDEDFSIVLSSGLTSSKGLLGTAECKQRCSDRDECGYFSYWKFGFCETYQHCYNTTQFDIQGRTLKDVKTFQRLTDCDIELARDDSRYFKAIAEAFPDDAVRYVPPKNIYCSCMTAKRAICLILVEPDTPQADIVDGILDRSNLHPPFKLNPMMDPHDASTMFAQERLPKSERIYADISILPVNKCLHTSICLDGTPGRMCPITKKPFEPGDAVMILKSDAANVFAGVPCISVRGMRLVSFRPGETHAITIVPLEDPFGRGMKHMNIDYDMYFIVDESMTESGICMGSSPPLGPSSGEWEGSGSEGKKKSNRKKKKKAKSGSASTSEDSDPLLPASAVVESIPPLELPSAPEERAPLSVKEHQKSIELIQKQPQSEREGIVPPVSSASSAIQYPEVGAKMKISGITSKPEMNGLIGVVESINTEKRRVAFRTETESILIKPANLIPFEKRLSTSLPNHSHTILGIFIILTFTSLFTFQQFKHPKHQRDVYIEFSAPI